MQPIALDSANLFRLVHFFDVLAAVVFAASGALVASRKGMDVMGFMWLAVITGVGGGTVRDLVLDVPVFWVQHPIYVSACLMTAMAMHFVSPLVESRHTTLLWFDAFGLALVTVAGTVKALGCGCARADRHRDGRRHGLGGGESSAIPSATCPRSSCGMRSLRDGVGTRGVRPRCVERSWDKGVHQP